MVYMFEALYTAYYLPTFHTTPDVYNFRDDTAYMQLGLGNTIAIGINSDVGVDQLRVFFNGVEDT